MHERLEIDEPFDTQLNIRFRERTFRHIPRLQKVTGENKQQLFDRLVGEEYERYILENGTTMIAENQAKIAELLAEIDLINVVINESNLTTDIPVTEQ